MGVYSICRKRRKRTKRWLQVENRTRNIHRNMAINVYQYGRGGKCVYMFRHTYAGITEKKMQMEKEFRHIRRVMHTSIGTVT